MKEFQLANLKMLPSKKYSVGNRNLPTKYYLENYLYSVDQVYFIGANDFTRTSHKHCGTYEHEQQVRSDHLCKPVKITLLVQDFGVALV